jgi:hypothetical protein
MMSFDRLNTSLRGDFIPNSSIAKNGIQSSPHLFTEELRNTEGTQSSPQIDIDLFREKIKAALNQDSPTRGRAITDDEGTGTNKAASQFSTNYK